MKNYTDKMIKMLRAKYHESNLNNNAIGDNVSIGSGCMLLHRENLFEEKFTMLIPDNVRDMAWKEIVSKYRNRHRPQIIKTNYAGDITLTFSILSTDMVENREIGVLQKMEQIRNDMKKIWKQNVFYDIGEVQAETLSIAWMDFKAFCFNGDLYSMIFIFEIEDKMILGNFHCSFPQYDMWKPAMLKLLTTIRTDLEETGK